MNSSPEPSLTALLSAAARAAHLVVDAPPHILTDRLAERLLGDAGRHALAYHLSRPDEPVLIAARVSTTVRSRFAETLLAGSGCPQYVVLGAGLDTSALRIAEPPGRRSFHVDLPGMLARRRELLAAAGIETPPDVADVAVDLSHQELLPALVRAGFDPSQRAFVSWLGGTMYLPRAGVENVAEQLADLVTGSELVLDHVLPPSERDAAGAAYADAVAAAAGTNGEPWRTTVTGTDLADLLTGYGWRSVTCTGEAESLPGELWRRTDVLRPQRLIGLVHARR